MAAARQRPIPPHPPPSPPGQAPEDPEGLLDLIPGTAQAWRTKEGTIIGVVGRLSSGDWIAMLPDETLSAHASREDASLTLTLAYMRR